MTIDKYNPYLHKLVLCNWCQGKGKITFKSTNIEADCIICMGLGIKVYFGNTQITDRNRARNILISYVEQEKKTEIQAPKFTQPVRNQPLQHPPYSPFRDPNHPLNPNNPFGWTHPFSPNNPFWRNNPANPNSLNNPYNPANPNKPFKK